MKTINCLRCNIEIFIYPSRIGLRKYCSKKCAMTGKPKWNALAKLNVNCRNCNKDFIIPLSRKNKVKYCSVKCRQADWKITRLEEKAFSWKGNGVGYVGIHMWVKKNLGIANHRSFDTTHKSTRFNWANVSGSYLRDLGDWVQLCPKCHKQYDMIVHHPRKNIFDANGGRMVLSN